MNSILLYPIALPIIAALICLFMPRRAINLVRVITLGVISANVVIAGYLFTLADARFSVAWIEFGARLAISFDLFLTPFACLVLVAASIFALLVASYSFRYMANHPRQREYLACILATLGVACGVALANHLIVLLLFWELVGVMLYLMILVFGVDAMASATKTLVIAALGDLSVMLGIILIWLASGQWTLSELSAHPLALDAPLTMAAYLLILVGAFAKAGAIPMHSWIPTIATTAPIPTMAYLPASLDKLLGIYLLARISLNLFVMTPLIGLVLMWIGAITILSAVLMALVQHDYRKMLAFHAVSQVGYMVLGIGTGTPVGIIGGLFHMLNHAIYKCCLFLCGGSVQLQTGRTKFSELGGLARAMPWTFVTCLVAALAISGVPPMNGFVSKWLVYQGIIDSGSALFPIFLLVAMFGSALTLASFVKLLYSMFWGDRPQGLEHVQEASAWMLAPLVVLASFAVGFGVFYQFPVDYLIKPLLGVAGAQITIPGLWESGLAVVLLIASLAVGWMIYWLGRPRGVTETEVFLGGEAMDPQTYRVPGTHFYGPIKELAGLKQLYAIAERGAFDLYGYLIDSFKWIGNAVYAYIEQAMTDLFKELLPALFSIVGQVLRVLNGKLVLTSAVWLLYSASIWAIALYPTDTTIVYAVRVIACVGMIGWAMLALVETDLMRLLFMATTSQIGLVVLGITLSQDAALSYLITSGLAMSGLIVCAESMIQTSKVSALAEMKGLAARMPGRFYLFLLAAFWLSGLPPFGNFFSKYLLGLAAEGINLGLSAVITGTAILTLVYLLRPIRNFLMVTGQDDPGTVKPHPR